MSSEDDLDGAIEKDSECAWSSKYIVRLSDRHHFIISMIASIKLNCMLNFDKFHKVYC